MLYEILREKRGQILKIASKNGIKNVRVFGSVARFEDGPTTDIDLLVECEEGRNCLI